MLASSIFDYLKNKRSILKVEKNSNPFKFSYKHNKFSLCLKNIGFAYRTNLDEYRVQIAEKFREQLKSYHLQGYWALILGYHKKSNTYVAWDNKLLFSSKAKNRSLYLKEEQYIFRTVLGNVAFESGLHYWEIVADARTENELKVGVCKN